MARNLAVILTSGGLDSAVAAALARQDSLLALLHLNYGQQAGEMEQRAFQALCDHFKPAYDKKASLGEWRAWCQSPALQPTGDLEDAPTVTTQIAKSFVPMLAPAMLCAAVSWACTIGAQRVVWGISLANAGNYPDRADAVRLLAWQMALRAVPEGRCPSIDAPLSQYDKPAVLELAQQLKVPVELTWSCLRNGPAPCGRCIGCATRKAALDASGVKAV